MTHKRSFIPRTFLAGVLIALLAPVVGMAQQKADSKTGPAAGAQPVAAPGVLVVGVLADSPADKAGVARGDIIIAVNGTVVNGWSEVRQALAAWKSGQSIVLKVRHGDAEKSLTLVPGTQDGRPWLGILPQRDHWGPRMWGDDGPWQHRQGALVAEVAAGSPAEKAGLSRGDAILAVDGKTVDAASTLADLIGAKKVGDTVTLSVEGPGQTAPRDVKVTLAKNPDRDGPYLGVQYMEMPPRFDRGMRGPGYFGQDGPGRGPGPGMMAPGGPGPGARGAAFVAEVAADGPAAKAGIEPRDLITKVEGAAVKDPRQVVEAVARHKPGDTLALTVFRRVDGKEIDLTVTLGKNPGDASKPWLGVTVGEHLGPGGPQGMMRTPTSPSEPGRDAPTL